MNEELRVNEYQCAKCKGMFEYGWSEEEAKKEAELAFGKKVEDWQDKAVLVCDYCYKKMLPSDYPEVVAYAKTKI